jgi:uncharacterized protein YecA (UPF0149 family)
MSGSLTSLRRRNVFLPALIAAAAYPLSRERDSTEKGECQPVRKRGTLGRNTTCPCGSGKKYKRCCMGKRAGG